MGRSVVWFAMAAVAVACSSGDFAGGPPAGEGGVTVRPVRVADPGRTAVNGDLSGAAVQYARSFDAELGLSDLDELEVRHVHGGSSGNRHVRLRQLHQGLPVWGADIVVHADGGRRFVGLNGTLAVLDEIDAAASLTAGEAMSIGRAAYAAQLHGRAAGAASLTYARESAELVVYAAGPGARPAWHIEFFTELQAGIRPGLWNYFVDARTGAILYQLNAIDTLEQASGPGGNPEVTRTWTAALDVEPDRGQFAMNTARLVTTDMGGGTSGIGTIVVGPLDPIGDAPINDAHGFAEVTLDMMQDWYGHNSIDDGGFIILSRVHYGIQFENAFWNGIEMTYGDGGTFFHPLSGDVDVVGHEINHGFTTLHSNLIYAEQSGGTNESFSDIAGTLAEFFAEGDSADFDIGRDIFQQGDALRFMCDPPADGISIDQAADFIPGMDVHFSSGVMNKAFCLSARRLASGTPAGPATQTSARRAGEAWYEANASYWTAGTDFEQACDGVLAAAGALGFTADERALIRQSWQDVGVVCDGAISIECDETLTGETGTVTSPNYPGSYPDSFSRTYCIQPASGRQATLTFDAFATEEDFDFVQVRDATGFRRASASGFTPPPPTTSTLIAITFTSDINTTASGWSASWTTGAPNQPPVASITEPADGAQVSGVVAISATASDPDGTVARVEFELPGGASIDDTTVPYRVSWDSTSVEAGIHTIGVRAFDDQGAASEVASIDVDVCADCEPDTGPSTPDAGSGSGGDETGGDETGDDGGTDDGGADDGGGGGGCAAAGGSQGGLLAALLVGLALVRRRSRVRARPTPGLRAQGPAR